LDSKGAVAKACYSAEEALLLRSEEFQPDILISDVMMKGMSGIDLAIEVTKRSLPCKILLISGQATTADLLEDAKKLGYEFEVLAKPVHPNELIGRLSLR
jgi:DNA-binding NtrC family response regulator